MNVFLYTCRFRKITSYNNYYNNIITHETAQAWIIFNYHSSRWLTDVLLITGLKYFYKLSIEMLSNMPCIWRKILWNTRIYVHGQIVNIKMDISSNNLLLKKQYCKICIPYYIIFFNHKHFIIIVILYYDYECYIGIIGESTYRVHLTSKDDELNRASRISKVNLLCRHDFPFQSSTPRSNEYRILSLLQWNIL